MLGLSRDTISYSDYSIIGVLRPLLHRICFTMTKMLCDTSKANIQMQLYMITILETRVNKE